jgi:alpha-galactosidase
MTSPTIETAHPTASVVVLRAAGSCIVLDVAGPALPRVLHWGADLGVGPGVLPGPLSAELVRSLVPAVPNSALDHPWSLTLLPVEDDGWSGAQGLEGHRSGAAAHPRLRLVGEVEVVVGDGGSVLARAADPACGLEVEVSLRMSPSGVVELDASVTNAGDGTYDVAALRVGLPLPVSAAEVLDLTGRWCREAAPQRSPLRHGTWRRASRRGRTGHEGPLFVAAGDPGFGFGHGEVRAVHLAWSGDHEHLVERLPEGAGVHAGVLATGELLRAGEVRLAGGESYRTPTALFSWSDAGLDGVAQRWHRWQRTRPGHPSSARPVVLNTWEAVYFDHDLDRLRALADVAASIGVERFVLDDGWFHGRRDDRRGLGDWTVDGAVWPDGLHPLVDHVRGLGMQVGLWVEPEMVNVDSDLVRAHPDWVLRPTTSTAVADLPPDWRHQQVLDLTHPEAFSHLLDRLDALVAEYHLDYLKWDHNRDLHAAGSSAGRTTDGPAAGLGAVVHEQTLALYRLLDALRAKHPGLEIESCASGGARVDLGILGRTDRVWGSDCNDAVERQAIQRWTTQLLAPELVGGHVGPPTAHTTHRTVDLGMRLVTSLFGHAGIEWDVTATTPDERARLAAWIGLHRELRALLHSGDVVRADLPGDDTLLHGVVATDRSAAVYAFVRIVSGTDAQPGLVRLPGLDPLRQYDVRVRLEVGDPVVGGHEPPPWLADGVRLPGSVLTQVGLAMPVLTPASAMVLHLSAV